jgi:hypothetical protein
VRVTIATFMELLATSIANGSLASYSAPDALARARYKWAMLRQQPQVN